MSLFLGNRLTLERSSMVQPNIGILGTGFYVPEKVLTNDELEISLRLERNWIRSKTGIRERRVAAPHEATSDLATRAAAFDISAVCAGFVYALAIVQSAMQGNTSFKKALIIGTDTYSRILDYQDRRTCVLFGDGAGAVVLGQVPEGYGILSCYIRSDG